MTRLLTLAALAALVLPAAAQTPEQALPANNGACRATFDELVEAEVFVFQQALPDSANVCRILATQIFARGARAVALARSQLTPRLVQPAHGQTGGLGGSPAQSEATTGVEPVALAGGALSAATTSEGSGSIASLSINPAVFFAPSDPNRLAELTRRGDLTLLAPIDGADRDGNGRLDYVGVRARYDMTGAERGRKVVSALETAFAALLVGYAANLTEVRAQIDGASDVRACARALLGLPEGRPGACAETPPGTAAPIPPQLEARFAAIADSVRRAADAAYWGVDLRLDVGDPTLGGTPGADGLAGGLGLAGGYRFGDGPGAPQARIRFGTYFADRDSLAENRIGVDGSLGLVSSRLDGLQVLSLGLALEFQLTSGPDADVVPGLAELDRDYVRLRGALNVPIGGTYSVSLSAAVGTDGPTLSIGGNWQTLLPGR